MEVSAPGTDPQAPRAGPRRWKVVTIASAVCLLAAAFGGIQFFAARFWSAHVKTVSIRVPLSIVILAGVALWLTIAGILFAYLARWRIPARRLREALEGIRARERPIEELRLPESAGGLSPLLLHTSSRPEFRWRRMRMAEFPK